MLAVVTSRFALARGRTARVLSAAVGASLLIGALVTPALGAPRPLTMDILIGDFCVGGDAKPNTVIKFVVKDISGGLKGRSAMMSAPDGTWSGCVDFFADGFAAGDKIKVVDYDTNQQLNYTIPRLTLAVNRTTDVVSGKAPAGMHLTLEAVDFNTPFFGEDPYDVIKHVTANGSGAYSHDFGNDGADLRTGALLEVRSSGAGGAITVRRQMSVPGLYVLLNEAVFAGYMRPYFPIDITLKVNGSKVATGSAVGDGGGQYDGRFVDADGEFYRVAGGESLKAPALGIAWTVPQVNGTVSRQTDVVSGTCFPNSPWVVLAGIFGFANGTTDGSGAFSVDVTDQTDLVKGDQVAIGCFTKAGDVVEEDLVVQ